MPNNEVNIQKKQVLYFLIGDAQRFFGTILEYKLTEQIYFSS